MTLFLAGFLLGVVAAWALARPVERIRQRFAPVPLPRGSLNWSADPHAVKRSHRRPSPTRLRIVGHSDAAIATALLRWLGFSEVER